MLINIFITLFVISTTAITIYGVSHCKHIKTQISSEFYLVAPCHRSTLKIIATSNHVTLDQCKILASRRKGMAFNYSSNQFNMSAENGETLKKCMVLSCPEIENSTSLLSDTSFNYYSIYADPIPPANSSCVEGIGVFVYHLSKLNYTTAKETCEGLGAILADVGTEIRTNQLSKLLNLTLSDRKIRQVYVGMDDIEISGQFKRSNGEMLTCSTFRAWEPGHPKSKLSRNRCMILNANKTWKVVDCKTKHPFVCEILPSGWKNHFDYLEQVSCDDYDLLY